MNIQRVDPIIEEMVRRTVGAATRLEMIALQARQVRVCQREYFKTRSKDAMLASMAAERALDELLAAHFAVPQNPAAPPSDETLIQR
jgi:hypothetical protein